MQQYKDDLLASCLRLVLSVPLEVVILDVASFVPALKVHVGQCPCIVYVQFMQM